ncbi:MAG: hypothetical protein JJE28_02655, partial [Actinomycetales bacterium]|nr:hypothetical protein [Actinomycetales bacterium]
MKVDARLALPALGAWAAVVALLAPNAGSSAAILSGLTWLAAAIAALLAVVTTLTASSLKAPRFSRNTGAARDDSWVRGLLPAVALASFLTLALCLSILVHAPSHV